MENLRTIDVLIIGAGPAGTVCGSLLKQAGVECAVVDHATFPREKVCGGGLTVKAWRLLDELMPGIKYEYRSINHMRVQFEDDKVCDFHSEYEIRMTRRMDFDYDLLKYYQNHGGEFIKGSFARFEKQADGRILVTLKSGMQFSCRYLIAADGANSMIRKQMTGAPKMHALFLEYYVEGEHDDDIFVHFSKKYSPGCFYKFPSRGRDMYGFVNIETNEDWKRHSGTFREALNHFGVSEGRMRGAYIPLNTVESTVDHVILIGDAGGFPNKLTGEGLYDAFKTAYNAFLAITENKPFHETNAAVFKKMEDQKKVYNFFFSRFGYPLIRWAAGYPKIIKWMFDAKMKRETFRERR